MLTWPGEVALRAGGGGVMTEGYLGSRGEGGQGSEVRGSGGGGSQPVWGLQADICRANERLWPIILQGLREADGSWPPSV